MSSRTEEIREIDILSVVGKVGSSRRVKLQENELSVTILGTDNQIIVTPLDNGAVELSLPQDIDIVSDVQFRSIMLSSLIPSKFVKTDINQKLISSDFDDEEFEFYIQAVA